MEYPSHEEVHMALEARQEPFATTNDMAANFPEVSQRTVRERLKDLRAKGEIRATRVAGDVWIWWSSRYDSDEARSSLPSSESQ
jgi:hypothetical protein